MTLKIATFLCLAATLSAQPQPPTPLTTDITFQGVSFSARFEGTRPITYQWYRGTEKTPKVVKLPAPAGIQQVLELSPPYVAGWYTCEGTNAAGTVTYEKRFKLSLTKTLSAAEMAVVIKQP